MGGGHSSTHTHAQRSFVAQEICNVLKEEWILLNIYKHWLLMSCNQSRYWKWEQAGFHNRTIIQRSSQNPPWNTSRDMKRWYSPRKSLFLVSVFSASLFNMNLMYNLSNLCQHLHVCMIANMSAHEDSLWVWVRGLHHACSHTWSRTRPVWLHF